jgi:ABC-type Na+ transport system ATPase subunit NatA
LGSRRTVVAVDGVSFSAYPGQITTLLGHNGAGRSVPPARWRPLHYLRRIF